MGKYSSKQNQKAENQHEKDQKPSETLIYSAKTLSASQFPEFINSRHLSSYVNMI